MVLQGAVTMRLIRRFGMDGALVSMPLVALGSFVWLVMAPFLLPLAATQILRRGGEFGIARPCRETLFTAVDPETKYKAKNFIDTVVQRGSDTLAAWTHGLLNASGMLLAGFAALSAISMLVMIGVGAALGRAFTARENSAPAPAPAPAVRG